MKHQLWNSNAARDAFDAMNFHTHQIPGPILAALVVLLHCSSPWGMCLMPDVFVAIATYVSKELMLKLHDLVT